MKSIIITSDRLKRLSKTNEDRTSESNLYYTGDLLFKVLKEEFRNRKSTIIRLEQLHGEELILPKFLLNDENGFIGYVMHYFKDYSQLISFLIGKLPFEERKRISLELYRIINDLRLQNFAYYDIHLFNILYKDGNLKFSDMDSGTFKSNRIINGISEFEIYDKKVISGDYYLTLTILELLFESYGKPLLKLINKNKKELLKHSPDNMRKLFEYITREPMDEFDVSEYIKDIDENQISESKLILKK